MGNDKIIRALDRIHFYCVHIKMWLQSKSVFHFQLLNFCFENVTLHGLFNPAENVIEDIKQYINFYVTFFQLLNNPVLYNRGSMKIWLIDGIYVAIDQ